MSDVPAGGEATGSDRAAPSFDYYDFLDVDPDATRAEIKTAYNRLTDVCDPGQRGSLTEAYEVLTDPGRRAGYDRVRSTISRRLPKPARHRSTPVVDAGGFDSGARLGPEARSRETAPSLDVTTGDAKPAQPGGRDSDVTAAPPDKAKAKAASSSDIGQAAPPKPSAMLADEAKVVYLLALGQALAAVVITAALHDRAQIWRFFGINLVLAVAIAASARLANRFVALIAALAGGLFGLYPISVLLAAPHYGLAIWIMLRQNRAARVHSDWRRQDKAGARAGPGAQAIGGRASARRPSDDDRPATPAQRRRQKSEPAGRGAPRPSKRYTPPKTKTKRR